MNLFLTFEIEFVFTFSCLDDRDLKMKGFAAINKILAVFEFSLELLHNAK